MANVAHAKKSPVSETTGCACGWGRHCLCIYDHWFQRRIEKAARQLLASGGDLAERRRAHESMSETVDLIDQRERDQKALIKFYKTLPRYKDIELCRRLLNDDTRSRVWTDEEIADWMRTPIEHVRDLRARVGAVLDGKPLPVPREWRIAARERHARDEEKRAARAARKAARRAA
jgi:hypothetical protein